MNWKHRRLAFEPLEVRRLLAADITLIRQFSLWDGGVIPSTDGAGITYHPPSGHLYLSDSEINEISQFEGNNIFEISLLGDQLFREIQSHNSEPTGITYNQADGFFYVTNDNTRLITRYDINLNTPLATTDTRDALANAADPEGITSNPSNGDLYVIDGSGGGRQVLIYDKNLNFQSSFPVGAQMSDGEGIAFHPTRNHLFIVSDPDNKIFEYTLGGTFVDEYDISGFRPRPKAPQGLTFAPTSDPDDDPGSLALYIADGMKDNFPDGRLYEALIEGTGELPDPPGPSKFFVVDSEADATFEYDLGGTLVTNYPLANGNSSARGATTNAAGTRVWVIDQNNVVFLYDQDGNQLGSWTAGQTRAPEGIATDGSDVWIVDGRNDTVFRYAAAAAADWTSGSHQPASSFPLSAANRKPKGIASDGSFLWIVNEGRDDTVFKYNDSGTLLGSWTISNENTRPTGITIDPNDVNDIWIVDDGVDQVFQYSGAASRVGGSQSADIAFDLVPLNNNPQGIADPPASPLSSSNFITGVIDLRLGLSGARPNDNGTRTRVLEREAIVTEPDRSAAQQPTMKVHQLVSTSDAARRQVFAKRFQLRRDAGLEMRVDVQTELEFELSVDLLAALLGTS